MLGASCEGGSVAARIFLGLSALIWLPFGVYCFFQPGFFAEAAGVSFTTPTGATDMRATYGGLTTAIGVFALSGALRPALTRQGLVLLASACAGLGGARLLGVALDGGLSSWTVQALVLELGTVALGAWLLRRA
jgi:Domain of unknown function (DUF4345)